MRPWARACSPPACPRTRGSGAELDPLRQRQVPSPVDRRGLASHLGFPGVGTGLAATAGLLLAAECAADLRAAGSGIHIGDAAVRAGGREESLRRAQAVGEDRARE